METQQTALSTALTAAGISEASGADPRLHGEGAKGNKVPAKAGADSLKLEAIVEAEMIIGTGLSRMQHWVKLANSCKSQPELLMEYPDFLRDALYNKVKLPIPTKLHPKSKWTDESAKKLAERLDVDVSQARKAMTNLATKFDATIKVLQGKGTYQDKLKALPSVTPARSPSQPKGPEADKTTPTGKAPEASKETKGNVILGQVIDFIQTCPEIDVPNVAQAIAIRLKASKQVVHQNLAADIFKALDAYDKATDEGETENRLIVDRQVSAQA